MGRILVSMLVALFCLVQTYGQQTLEHETCDRSKGHQAIIQPDADAFISGLFPFHSQGENGVGCSGVETGVMQSYEAIRWALDRLNKKDEVLNGQYLQDYYIPGVRIGMMVEDYCNNPTMASVIAERMFPQFSASARECARNSNKLMLGMLGDLSSDTAKVVHNFAHTYKIPLISYTSTAPELSNTAMYPYMMRTIAPDGLLMKAIVEFIGHLGWDYIVIVYTDDSYGTGAYKAIRPILAEAGICLTSAIATDPNDVDDAAVDHVFDKIISTNTTGVIYLGTTSQIDAILKRGEQYNGAGKLQWIVTDSVSLSYTFPGQTYPRGLISVVPAGRKIIEFEDHWVRIDSANPSEENPWYRNQYMKKYMCRLPGVTNSEFTTECPLRTETERRNNFVQDQFVEPAVHGVFTYARALKMAHQALCGGAPGMCSDLRSLKTSEFYSQYMRDIDFTYGKAERVESLASFSLDPYRAAAHVRFEGNDMVNPSFEVFSFNDYPYGVTYKFQSIGTYINNLMEIVTSRMRFYNENRNAVLPYVPLSNCPSDPCGPCLGALVDSKYVYIPGDILINAAFSIHMPGKEPISCGDFITSSKQGIQSMEAFIYAVEFVNSQFPRNGRLQNVKLGALGFDDCLSPTLSNHLITEVQRYERKITDENGENPLDPRSVEAFMTGGLNPWLPISMANLMNTMKRPMIGVDAYSQTLNDDDSYPYFLRGHYDIAIVANAVVNVAKRMGWHYLQSVYHDSVWGKESNDVLKKVAAQEGICIVASYGLEEGGNAAMLVDNLRGRPEVQPIAVLLMEYDFRNFLEGVKQRNAGNDFQLISAIGDSRQVVKGYEDYIDGMISFELWWPTSGVTPNTMPTLESFEKNHLQQLDIKTYMKNPWMKEWYENFYDCKFNPSITETQCGNDKIFNDFEMNTDIIAVIYGVFAIAQGLDETLKQYCGNNYDGVCGNFVNVREKGEVLMRNILSSARYAEDINIYEFIDTSGNLPIKYYNYNGEGKTFSSVGIYQPAKDLLYLESYRLNGKRLASEIPSACSGVCMECMYLFGYQKFMFIPGDIIIPGIFDVHYQGSSPYSCSDLRVENGFQYTEAFRYAIELVNRGTAGVKLNGVTLGGLGFDGCTDQIRASAIVTGMYSGAFPAPDTDLATTEVLTDDLAAWLTYDSESTISVSTILKRFGVPSVTPGATSPVLDDKSVFTNFFRTIPSDSLVAEAMAKLSQKLGFSYIITLNAPEDGSRDAVKKFREYAEAMGICVGASYEFGTDGSESQLMTYILQSTTKVVAVFANPDQYIEELIRVKAENPQASNLIFITNQPWSKPAQNVQISQSPIPASISFSMDGSDELEEFLTSLVSESYGIQGSANPWFREYYQEVMECNLAGSYKYTRACADPSTSPLDITRLSLDIRVIPTINAVYAITEGIHRTLQQKCGENYSGLCAAFLSDTDTYDMIMMKMDNSSFKDITDMVFRFIEREADRSLRFTRYLTDGSEQLEGTYSMSGNLDILYENTLMAVYSNIPSTCIGQCAQCDRDSSGLEDFMYSDGDILIGGLFDIHEQGSTHFTCGKINDVHGFQLMEAFVWAVDYVNKKLGMFRDKLYGVKLGYLIFDTCSSPVRAGNLIANYHARNFEIRDQYRIDPSLIDLYIGPMTSEASIRVADVLSEIGIPQISYGATSLELRDQRKYRYFIRTVPADDKQSRAIIAFLKKYQFNNIQLISQFSTVGEFGRDEFVRLAELNEICIAAEFVVGQTGHVTEEEARIAVESLPNNPDARIIVVIMDDPYTLFRIANSYAFITGNYSFIGTDKWGFGINGYENLDDLYELIEKRNVVTLDLETADFPELDLYLEDKRPENYASNPWFREYYEHVYNCTFQPVSSGDRLCSQYLMGYPRAEGYIQDPQALYVINAVFATALGLHDTIEEWCGQERFVGLCSILRNNGEKREYYLNNIKKVRFIDHTDQPFYFTDEGESDRGYHLYEPRSNGLSLHGGYAGGQVNGYYWEDIGSYNDTHYLKMDARYDPEWNGACTADSCKCEFPEYQPSHYLKNPSPLDLNLVFISDIHKAGPNNIGCGPIDTGSNLQTLLAFLYAIESVNNNSALKFPGSLKLGGIALDTCSQPSHIGQDVYSLLSGEPVCGEEGGVQVVPPASIVSYIVRNSANSIAASSMLSPLKVTTFSMSATSVELNDKLEHTYFLRTVPPDNVQALIVSQILKEFGWDYVSIVYADNTYGRSAMETLLGQSDRNNPELCFGRTIPMALGGDLKEAKAVIDMLNQQIGSRVVVTFVTSSQVRQLLQATTEKGLNHRFIWIGSDTWANNNALTKGYEETAAGAVTIQIRSEYSQLFRDFVKNITFNNRKGIPDDWFEEIYQTVHQCRILSSQIRTSFTRICSGDERFTDDMIPNDPFVLHTIIAVYQIAYGLSDVEACRQLGLTIASCLSLQPDRRQIIYDNILNAQHDVLPEDLGDRSFGFKFTADGYGDIGYNVYNYRKNLESGQYEYIKIGSSSGELQIRTREYKSYSFTDRSLPLSRCPIGSSCQCLDKTGTFTFSRQADGYVVTDEGQYVDPQTGQLVTIEDTPAMSDRFRDIWAIIVSTLAALGAFSALCMFVYLLVVYPVRGGTTILGYMLCFGIILMYVLVFAFIVHASEEVCGLRRFALGFVYSIAYSALFVKLVDCWRTKDKEDIYMVKYNKIGNPWGLFFSACLIVLVQVMINAEWLILEEPAMARVIYNNKLWPRCVPDDFYDEGLILSNVFIMFLIFVSVLVGLAAFGNDKNHWDCRWIVGCVVLTIPAWMVWCLVAALGEYKMRDAAVAIGLLYNATVMLLCGPMRKLYLLNKYQAKLEEEERKSQIYSSQKDYNSMYGRQYDNAPRMHDSDSMRGSTMGQDDVFLYEPKS